MKKSVFVVTLILLLSLLATSTVSAGTGPKLPAWERVFNPKEKTGEDFIPGEEELLPAQVYRSFDGVNWELATPDGFGDPGNIATWSFGQEDSYLYLGMGNFNGGQIWRTKDGMDWQSINQDGLGDPSNLAFGFVTYQKMPYAYSVNLDEGCRVYASRDGILYTSVNEPGRGDPANSAVSLDNNWAIFKGALYMGVTGWGAPAPGGVFRLVPPKNSYTEAVAPRGANRWVAP